MLGLHSGSVGPQKKRGGGGADHARGQKNRTRKKTNSWERRFPGTFRTNVPLILPIFSVFSVGGCPKVPRNFVPGNFFFLILGGFSPCDMLKSRTSRGMGPLNPVAQGVPCQRLSERMRRRDDRRGRGGMHQAEA